MRHEAHFNIQFTYITLNLSNTHTCVAFAYFIHTCKVCCPVAIGTYVVAEMTVLLKLALYHIACYTGIAEDTYV